jgi:pyruvate/2-oxoglutarate/acetoin dehydrogenase E1 component
MRVVESLNAGLHGLMEADDDVLVIGQDILDPYGGAFKVTRGLSSKYPDRVMAAPISEAAIVGCATGLALRGRRPFAEIMFGDFMTLAMDQLVNHAAKFPWMYNGQVSVPLVVRAPMGGRRGYGPTHSQSLEKHLCGVPGLTVLALHQYMDPAALFREAYALKTPVVVIENKVLYAREVRPAEDLHLVDDPEIVFFAYGGSVEVTKKAADILLEDEEVGAKVVAVTKLSPFAEDDVLAGLGNCRAALAIEEGAAGWGFAAEVARALINKDVRFDSLAAPSDHPIPAGLSWEQGILPNAEQVRGCALNLLGLT